MTQRLAGKTALITAAGQGIGLATAELFAREGARVLVPSCSRVVEPGMVVRTGNDRVKHTRKMVLELLASSVDLSTTPGMDALLEEYDCDPARYGPPAPPSAASTSRTRPTNATSAPPEVDLSTPVVSTGNPPSPSW